MGIEAAIKYLYEQRAKQLGIEVEIEVKGEVKNEMDSHKTA